jgi:putative Holliday junction resolvase
MGNRRARPEPIVRSRVAQRRDLGRALGGFAGSNVLCPATRYNGRVTPSESSSPEITPGETPRTRVLGIDYGRARIGLAVADTLTALARPLDTLERINRNEDMRRLREIVRAHGVKHIVVGLPLRLDGTRGEMAEEAARFAERVRKQLGVPVEMVDERLTSWEAERLLEEQAGRVRHRAPPSGAGRASRTDRQKRVEGKNTVDAMAAAVILREYLEQRQDAGKNV